MARNRKGPPLQPELPAATSEDSHPYENSLTLIPITYASDTQKPGLGGLYRIPPELYKSLSESLNPNSKWGFVMCCVGGQDGVQLENRIASVKTYLEWFVGESKKESGNEEIENDEEKVVKAEMPGRDVDVTIEIGPRTKHDRSGSIDAKDDELGRHTVTKAQVAENSKRRKATAIDRKATRLRDAIRALENSDDGSDSENERKLKRQKHHRSDQTQLDVQLEQSNPSTIEESDELLLSKSQVQVPLCKATTMKQADANRPKQGTSGAPRTLADQWPEVVLSIGPTDGSQEGLTSKRAIELAIKRGREKGWDDNLKYYAAFFARLFSPDTIATLLHGCKKYAIAVLAELPTTVDDEWAKLEFSRSAQRTTTCEGPIMMEQEIPAELKELLDTYKVAEAEDRSYGVSVGVALRYYRYALFARKFVEIREQIIDQKGKAWDYLWQWTLTVGRGRTGWTDELCRFIVEQLHGQSRSDTGKREWMSRMSYLGRLRRKGDNLVMLMELCTPAICLLIGMSHGEVAKTAQGLHHLTNEILEILPEFNVLFQELNERLWQPMMRREKLPSIRLLSLKHDEDGLKKVLEKKSMRYWLEFEDRPEKIGNYLLN
ncbi:MAG: hypothetical protein Q9168_005026 [Polycauliona sp. 1 TL-2023]